MQGLKVIVLTSALAAVGFASPVAAQQEEEIVVTGLRLREMVREFVGEVAVAVPSENQLARWDRRVCTQLAGLGPRQAQFIIDRIALRSFALGLAPGEPGCQANVLVFVTPDSDRLARALEEQFREVLDARRVPHMATAGEEALADFVATRRPVRWWHVMQTVSADGQLLRNTDPRRDPRGGFTNLEILHNARLGRVQRTTRQDFNRVVIIVDATLADGVHLTPLADYIAMAALAQVNAQADVSAVRSILNLFSDRQAGREPVAEMSEWDLAYLEALYGAQRNASSAARMRADIARAMEEEPLRVAH